MLEGDLQRYDWWSTPGIVPVLLRGILSQEWWVPTVFMVCHWQDEPQSNAEMLVALLKSRPVLNNEIFPHKDLWRLEVSLVLAHTP